MRVGPHVPTLDFFKHIDLDAPGDVDEILDNLIFYLKTGYFVLWEAVVRRERGLRLSGKHRKALEGLISFSDQEDDRILYIDELPRPREPWYETARKIVPCVLREPLRTDEGAYWATCEGWPALVEALGTHGRDLPLPKGAKSPLDVFPVDLRHRLWLQVCFDALIGLGQDEALTLERQGFRVEWLIRCLKEHKDSVLYFDLTLEGLLTRVITPPKDEKILAEMLTQVLGLTSSQDRLADFL
jgi:hypothetical protein